MRIALFGTQFNSAKAKYVQHLVNKLEQENIKLIIENQFNDNLVDIKFKKEFDTFETPQELKEKADILLSIGGDGTLLGAITFVRDSDIPILGINTGTLGFISSVSTDQIEYAINHLLKGEYKAKNFITIRKRKQSIW